MRPFRQHVINDGYETRHRRRQCLIDFVKFLDLIRRQPHVTDMNSLSAYRLDDKLAHV